AAFVIGPAFLARYGIATPAADLAVTWFPLAFSTLFFGIPGVRWLRHRRRARRIEGERARAQVIGELWSRRGAAATPDDLASAAAKRATASSDRARVELERLLPDPDGA